MISIIVPVYNLENYVARTLDSLLGQTFKDIEIIVVNDGSNDRSGEIIDEYAKKFPNKIKPVHLDNGGVTRARLAGIQQSSGEWIGFVDGDDYVEEYMYKHLYENAMKFEADISHCGYQIEFSDGRKKYFYNSKRVIVQDRSNGIKDLLEGKIIEPGLWNKLFKRELLIKLINRNLMDLDIKYNEDLLMNYYLFSLASRAVFEDICPYHYLVRGASASHQTINKKMVYDMLRVRKIIIANADPDLKIYAKNVYYNIVIDLFSSLLCAGYGYYEELPQELRSILMNEKSFAYLNNRKKILYFLIRFFPAFYNKAYRVYEKLSTKKY